MPNETWQSDFTHYRLASGADPRSSPGSTTTPATHSTSRPPPRERTDRARHLPRNRRPTRLPGISPDRQRHRLHDPVQRRARRPKRPRNRTPTLDIIQKNSRPNHPTTCGKVERFQQTMKKWLRAQPIQPTTLADLQTLLDPFLDATTTSARIARCRTGQPQPPPTTPAPRPPPQPTAATTSTTESCTTSSTRTASSPASQRPHAPHRRRQTPRPNPVIKLVDDLNVRIVNAATGELIRELTLDPSRDYQPPDRPPK